MRPETMIYLDNAATTRTRAAIMNLSRSAEEIFWANPSSANRDAFRAREAIEDARMRISSRIGVPNEWLPHSVYFTSGATEGNNWCLRGAVSAWLSSHEKEAERTGWRTVPNVVSDKGEHFSVLNTVLDMWDRRECVPVFVPLDPQTGRVRPEDVAGELDGLAAVISVMMVNNETGARNPVEEIGRVIQRFNRDHKANVLYHVDATQAVGKIPVDVREIGCDMLTASGHKFHAGKGNGFVFMRPEAYVTPLLRGGGQQHGKRPGTEDTVAALRLADALEYEQDDAKTGKIADMTEWILRKVREIPGSHVNGEPEKACGIVSAWFDGVNGEALLSLMESKGVILSAGSACSAGEPEPSHVLRAMDAPEGALYGTVRISAGALNTLEEVSNAMEILKRGVERLRKET